MAEPVEMGVGGGLNPTWYTHMYVHKTALWFV